MPTEPAIHTNLPPRCGGGGEKRARRVGGIVGSNTRFLASDRAHPNLYVRRHVGCVPLYAGCGGAGGGGR